MLLMSRLQPNYVTYQGEAVLNPDFYNTALKWILSYLVRLSNMTRHKRNMKWHLV